MDKNLFHSFLQEANQSDYGTYLNLQQLFACQTNFTELCNGDELQFQIVHQSEELLMNLIVYTLLSIIDYMQGCQTNKIISLFKRVHQSQHIMLNLLDLLGTMSPKEYQEIRAKLGNGSGRDSPGFRAIQKMFIPLWEAYHANYLQKNNLTIEQIYNSEFNHQDAYLIAENLLEFEILFKRFLMQHIQVVNRSIGSEAKSLNGNDIQQLNQRLFSKFFPELWKVRNDMTDHWGQTNGYVRGSLSE